ncbi:hypothetical protein AVEN_90583-1 [Araneus ventricosus]|uniref:Uncharacterized protein n=1 Tax=Araneus ventricosus TaxID=182803 RepID=A0A4Y1ZMC8_ARAVE|nr:hypothetical protein AVEN_90583-1 [Araneus ventricosus]
MDDETHTEILCYAFPKTCHGIRTHRPPALKGKKWGPPKENERCKPPALKKPSTAKGETFRGRLRPSSSLRSKIRGNFSQSRV